MQPRRDTDAAYCALIASVEESGPCKVIPNLVAITNFSRPCLAIAFPTIASLCRPVGCAYTNAVSRKQGEGAQISKSLSIAANCCNSSSAGFPLPYIAADIIPRPSFGTRKPWLPRSISAAIAAAAGRARPRAGNPGLGRGGAAAAFKSSLSLQPAAESRVTAGPTPGPALSRMPLRPGGPALRQSSSSDR